MIPSTAPQTTLSRMLFGAPGLVALAALYLLVGLIGHDPWRGDDARHLGPVFAMLQGEGLLLPHLAGEAVGEYPPLYYWTAAVLATLFSWALPAHDGARLATALYAALTLYWIAQAAVALHGREARAAAVLLTLGTLGLVIHAHQAQPLIALMAMQALTLAGLARLGQAPLGGALQAAAGAALAFLAAGLGGALLTLPLLFGVIALSPECRTPRISGALLLALCCALGAAALWPLALHYQQPELFALWWESDWGSFGGALPADRLRPFVEDIGWFTWPLWPIALWSLWLARRRLFSLPVQLPLAATVLAVIWLVTDYEPEVSTLLTLVAPLALLAAGGVTRLRRGAANAFDWFGVMTFAVFALLVWLGWTAQVFSWPPGLARHVARYGPDFVLQGEARQAVLGALACALWLLLAWKLPRSPQRGPANWAMGMTMLWCLAVILLMPWFQHGRSYRPAVEALQVALAEYSEECVASTGLSPSVRASLDYYAGLRPLAVGPQGSPCRLLLVHEDRRSKPPSLSPEWLSVWEHSRGGDKQRETFRLYHRQP